MGGSFAVFYGKGMQLRQHSTCCTTGLFAAWGCCCWDPEWSSATPPAGFLAGVPNERLRSSVAARSFTLKLNEKESSLHLIISGILPCSLATPTKNIPAVTRYKHNNNIIAVQGNWLSYPVPHSKHRLEVADPSPQIHLLRFAIHKNCKTTCPKVENEISNIVHVQCILHLLKARTTMANIFLSHSYILVFLPKSLFSITLILICITLSLVPLLGNNFSFHLLHCIAKEM